MGTPNPPKQRWGSAPGPVAMAAPRRRGAAARRHGVTRARPSSGGAGCGSSRSAASRWRGLPCSAPLVTSARPAEAAAGGGGAARAGPARRVSLRGWGGAASGRADSGRPGSGPGREPRPGRAVGAGPKQKAGGWSGPAAAPCPAAEDRVPPSGPRWGPRPAASLFAAEGGGGRA